MKPPRYHPVLVSLHWLLALMVVFSLAMGMFSLKEIPNASPDKLFALRGHMVAGVLILVLMLVRFAVRFALPRPDPATTGNRFLDRLSVVTHYGLYVLVVLMAASGIATAVQAGLPGIVFGGSGAPLPESFGIYRPRVAHGVIATLLLALAALHVLAALYHQFVRRDGLLSRMWFKRGRAAS
jgi:cytochrome b561